MKDMGFGLLDQRTILAVLAAALLGTLLLGGNFPIDAASIFTVFRDLMLLTGYLYITRSILRFPFALFMGIAAAIKGREYFYRSKMGQYLLNGLYSSHMSFLSDAKRLWAFVAGVVDQNSWRGFLGFIDRLMLIVLAVIPVLPNIGRDMMILFGCFGLGLMLIVYVVGGSFSFIVDDAIKRTADERRMKQEDLLEAIKESKVSIPSSISAHIIDTFDPVGGGHNC